MRYPWGKRTKEESVIDGLLREIYEETNIQLLETKPLFLKTVYVRYPNEIDFIYNMYEYRMEGIEPEVTINPEEHSEYRWITLKESLNLYLIRGEVECIYLVYSIDA